MINMGFITFSNAAMGLIMGGILAAPLAAIVTKRLSARHLMLAVEIILLIVSGLGLYKRMQ